MLPGSEKVLSLAEVEVLGTSPYSRTYYPNVALGKPTAQSSTDEGGVSSRAVDGDTSGSWDDGSISHTKQSTSPWWKVDLRGMFTIHFIRIWNRQSCCKDRLSGVKVIVWNGSEQVWTYTHSGAINKNLGVWPGVVGDKVEVTLPGIGKILSLAEVEVLGSSPTPLPTNVALGKTTAQSSTDEDGVSSRAVDGNTSGRWDDGSVTHTNESANPWWRVNLMSMFKVYYITIYNRTSCCKDRLSGFKVIMWNGSEQVWTYTHNGGTPDDLTSIAVPGLVGDKVEVLLPGSNRILSLAEVQVFGTLSTPLPTNVALSKPTEQSSTDEDGVSSRAVDGNTSGRWDDGSVTHTNKSTNPWWRVNLMNMFKVYYITIYNRTSCCKNRLSGFKVIVWNGNQKAWTYTYTGGTPDDLTSIEVPEVVGDKVEVMLPGSDRILSLAEVQIFGTPSTHLPTNVAFRKPTVQSSTNPGGAVSSGAVDGNTSGNYGDGSVTHTQQESNPFWEVDLQDMFVIDNIKVYNRIDDCCRGRLSGFTVTVWNENYEAWTFQHSGGIPDDITSIDVPDIVGDKVEVMLPGTERVLSLAEVQVFGRPIPTNVALDKPTVQSSTYSSGTKSSRAVDGNTSNYGDGSVAHTQQESNPFWKVDLQDNILIKNIKVYNRIDCCRERLSDFLVIVWNGSEQAWIFHHSGGIPNDVTSIEVPDVVGDKVEVRLPGTGRYLALAEVQVLGIPE